MLLVFEIWILFKQKIEAQNMYSGEVDLNISIFCSLEIELVLLA